MNNNKNKNKRKRPNQILVYANWMYGKVNIYVMVEVLLVESPIGVSTNINWVESPIGVSTNINLVESPIGISTGRKSNRGVWVLHSGV